VIHFRLGARDASYLYGMGSKESYCDQWDGLGAMGILMGSLGDSVGVPPTTLWITNNNNDFFDDDILCHHG